MVEERVAFQDDRTSASAPLRFPMPSRIQDILLALEKEGEEAALQGHGARSIIRQKPLLHLRRTSILTTANASTLEKVGAELAESFGATLQVEGKGVRLEGFRLEETGPSVSLRLEPYRTKTPPTAWFNEKKFEGIERDLATREITMNGFALRADGSAINPFGGIEDTHKNVLQSIVPLQRAFRENGLWVLKLAKYIGDYGPDGLPPDTLKHAQKHSGRILDVPLPLWKPHLDRILLSNHVEAGLDFLLDSGSLRFIVPEVVSMVDFHRSCPVHHKDLWDHTKKVIAQAEKNLTVRWAALMHDIGKIWTRTVNRERKVHFFRHEEFGAMLFLGVAGRLQFDDAFRDRVDYVIRNHSRVNLYDSSWTDSAIRRMIRECGDHMDELVMFSSADFTTKRESKARELRRQLAELHDRMEKITLEDARKPPLPKGIGNAIMKEFSVPPGRELGALRTWLESEIEEGNLAAQADPAIYLKHLSLFPDKIEAAGGSLPTGTDQNV